MRQDVGCILCNGAVGGNVWYHNALQVMVSNVLLPCAHVPWTTASSPPMNYCHLRLGGLWGSIANRVDRQIPSLNASPRTHVVRIICVVNVNVTFACDCRLNSIAAECDVNQSPQSTTM
jgi:hypothetical protein